MRDSKFEMQFICVYHCGDDKMPVIAFEKAQGIV